MANTIDWGKATQNNTNGFGKYQNTISAASIYADSYAGETALVGTSAAFSYSKSSYHQDEADPTPTITGTTGGSFNGSAGLVFADTGTHNSTTGQIDLSASTIDSHIITYTVDGVQSGQTVGVTASPFLANTYSMEFDGVNDYVESNFNADGYSSLSISGWIKATNPQADYNHIISNHYKNNTIPYYQFACMIDNNGKLLWRIGNTSPNYYTATSTTTIKDNSWHHFVGTYGNGNLKIYIDGTLEDTTSASGNLFTTGNKTSIGSYIDITSGSEVIGGNFLGKIDEVAFWNTALGETAIQEIYNATANNTGKALDLSTDYNNYTSSSNLQYWTRLGD